MYQLFTITTIAFVLFTGCGNNSHIQEQEDIALNQNAKNYFGVLADAEVNIYELNGEQKKLLFKERTTSGKTIEEIGNFDPHLRDMQREKIYLYEITGGNNWDSDKNGILDNTPTLNKTIFRSVYKGFKTKVKWWHTKSAKNNIAPSEM